MVLVSLRDYQDEKCDVVHKYLPEEVRSLKAYGEIPESIVVEEEGGTQNNNDVDVAFQDSDEGDKEEEEETKKENKKKKEQKEMESEDSDDLDDVFLRGRGGFGLGLKLFVCFLDLKEDRRGMRTVINVFKNFFLNKLNEIKWKIIFFILGAIGMIFCEKFSLFGFESGLQEIINWFNI